MLAINLIKDIPDLFLYKPLRIQNFHQPVVLFFLITGNRKNPGMEVATTVIGNTKLRSPALAIGLPKTIAVILIAGISRRNSPCSATIIFSSMISVRS